LHQARADDAPGEVGEPHERVVADVAVIVPTRNEAGNVQPLLARLDRALKSRRAVVVFVDDSDDDTPTKVVELRDATSLMVILRHRPPGERGGGLGGAVVEGMRLVDATWIAVMDGDLQHPPELVATMLRVAETEHRDVVVASRYCAAGSAGGLSSPSRAMTSRVASAITRVAFPRRLRGVSDPMTGMFLVRGDVVRPDDLHPRGFKILLELLGRTAGLSVAEVPMTFGARRWGNSKASVREGARFLAHLVELRLATMTPRALRSGRSGRALLFGAVGLSGVAVNSLAFVLLRDLSGTHYVAAAIGATQVSTLWNWLLIEALVFDNRRSGTWSTRLVKFAAFNNITLLLRVPLLVLLVRQFEIASGVANVLTLVILFAFRFVFADRLIYVDPARRNRDRSPVRTVIDLSERPVRTTGGLRPKDAYLPYRYSIHGILTIGSEAPLPELEYFRAPWLIRDFDIEIRRAPVGSLAPKVRASVTRHTRPVGVTYQEHLGRLGANFRIEMGDPIRVTVGPLLHHSPHVLYTNVVEALLRFLLVSKGRMLLHSACLRIGNRGILVSARTDTGKTGTVLRLVRDEGALFLSDDMTIVEPDGLALCFPKPLTISSHTLRSLDVSELRRRENAWLQVQSRLHSKGGRSIGAVLGRLNLPIMSINAVTQIVIPPPKYAVDRLVLADLARCVPVSDLFIIERGHTDCVPIEPEQLVDELIDNTNDAYGFPPFASFAPSIVIGDDDYAELCRKEREILSQAVSRVPATRLGSVDFTWSRSISALAADEMRVATADDGTAAAGMPRQDRRAGNDRRRVGSFAAVAPTGVDDA
jgi:putative flippase GtrA